MNRVYPEGSNAFGNQIKKILHLLHKQRGKNPLDFQEWHDFWGSDLCFCGNLSLVMLYFSDSI